MKQDNYTVVYNVVTSNTVSIKQTEVSAKTYTLLLDYTSDVPATQTASTINCSGITTYHYDNGSTTSSLTSSYTVNVTYSENTGSSSKVNTGTTTWGSFTSATWTIIQSGKSPDPPCIAEVLNYNVTDVSPYYEYKFKWGGWNCVIIKYTLDYIDNYGKTETNINVRHTGLGEDFPPNETGSDITATVTDSFYVSLCDGGRYELGSYSADFIIKGDG